MATYRKKPVTVEAVQWTGSNLQEVFDFTTAGNFYGPLPIGDALQPEGRPAQLWVAANQTLLPVEPGEWILKDELGFYPCKEEIFKKTYERVA